jgi:hypothetical protein
MADTPRPSGGQNSETMSYRVPADPDGTADAGGSHASYTPSASIDEHSYGRSGGRPAALGSVPSVVVGGSSVVGSLPGIPATFRVGVDKNVSTPVSGS